MAYDFKTMSPEDLRTALSGPTGDTFARHIANAAINRVQEMELMMAHDARVFQGTFGWALEGMQESGKRYRRAGWNGEGMFIYLVDGSKFTVNREPLAAILGLGTEVEYMPHVDIRTADGKCATWNASQADMLATDWEEVD